MGVQLQHSTTTEAHNAHLSLCETSVAVLCCSWTPILSIDLRIFYGVFTQICAWLLDPANVGPPFYQPNWVDKMGVQHQPDPAARDRFV